MADRDDSAWQDEILAAIPSGVDPEQVKRCLALSPAERLDEMQSLLTSLEEARAPHGDRLPRPDSSDR